jgi:hypothetical protein
MTMHWKTTLPILGVLVVLFSACVVASQPVATATASPHLQIATYSATARVQADKVTTVSVSCKSGEQMLGGGFRSSGLFEYAAFIDASYPSSATSWTVMAAPAPSFLIEADVYCLPAIVSFGIQIVQATGSPEGRAACPQKTVVLSGGYQSSQPIGVSHPQSNGWMSASVSASIQVYVLCAASHILPGQVVTSVFNAHSSSHSYASGSGSVVCPAGQTATGGGFEGEDLIVGNYATRPGFAGWSVTEGGDTDTTLFVVCGTIQA